MNLRPLCLLLGLALVATATAADAEVIRVYPGESIQDAIDSASPGDTILVEPGTYQETGNSVYGLRISVDNLRLIGKKGAGKGGKVRLLAFGDQETGIYAAPPGCEYKDNFCADELKGFHVRGFTVQGFPVNGIQTRWVHGFKFIGNESINNLNNGIYPTLSTHGFVADNFSYGSLDTALWVAGCEKVRVVGNDLTQAPTGLEVTVSNNVYAAHNNVYNNTVGVGLYHPNAAGNPPLPEMADWVFEHNHVFNNNLPNPAPPGSFQAGLIPGYGFLLLGVSDHVVSKNLIDNNDSAGVAVLGWCTAVGLDGDPTNPRNCINSPPITDPSSNDNLISENLLNNNGGSPPPGLPGVELLYLQFEDASGNCFEDNEPPDASFFSSEDDGQLPTDGCVDDEDDDDADDDDDDDDDGGSDDDDGGSDDDDD
ncbi:MAG: right-handed parallel beta-helix repeat-containing protein [Myxococcota bacterium]|nr:right-handed parallel beta-helix repeat-containing protein [Myxococcota bacterium]